MKKALSIVISVLMLVSVLTFGASATGSAAPTAGRTTAPDWVITEICCDTAGDGTAGWSDGKDCGEFIEIYNNSGIALDLYQYCMTYNGNDRTSDLFETSIVEITPFKAGDYIDGSTLVFTKDTYTVCDLSNKPVNPETCIVEPGEVVVLWSMYCEPYYNLWNDGKGMSVADFRTFWKIPENVKVIAYDANSSGDYGGYDKNFNVKNSKVGTYGIALYSEALNTAANVAGSTYPVVYTESTELCCWATMDFIDQFTLASIANVTYNYTWDFAGYAATDKAYIKDTPYVADTRRMALLNQFDSEPTPGKLNTIQKMTLGVALDANETVKFEEGIMYSPVVDGKVFTGFKVNDTLYKLDETFTATAAGKYTFGYQYDDKSETTKPEETTKAPAQETTKAPAQETTKAPAQETTAGVSETTVAPAKEEGCGSMISFGVVLAMIPAYFVFKKKK